MKYLIKSTKEVDDLTGESLYWELDFGWSDRESATRFNPIDVAGHLPLNSELEEYIP